MEEIFPPKRSLIFTGLHGVLSEIKPFTGIAVGMAYTTYCVYIIKIPWSMLFREKITVCFEKHMKRQSKIDINRKTYDIRTWAGGGLYFSTYPPPTLILVTSLCQCVETRNIEVF
jgi:hypothetical protein